jgi:argininosuccinate lyase
MVHISRLAEELILWSSAEFAFIRLPDAFATGSSMMPQKKNPDVAELARGRTGRAIGALVNILTTIKGLPLTYNRDLQEDKPTLYDAEGTLVPTLGIFTEMIRRIEIDAERMRAAAIANYSLATDLADYLVRKGLPFREAHEAVGKLVSHAESKEAELHELPLAEYRRFSPLFASDVLKIDVMASVTARDVPGGTAPKQVLTEIKRARKRIAAYSTASSAPKKPVGAKRAAPSPSKANRRTSATK